MTNDTGKKILVVEDDKFYSAIYKKHLKFEGVKVEIAENGKEALESIKNDKPDLMLLDLIMPKMDGFSLLEKLKSDSMLDGIKVIVMTNLGQEEDKEKALKLGAIDYIVKSNVSFDEIYDVVKKYLQ